MGRRRVRLTQRQDADENDLAGQGASARVTGTYFADGHQHLDYDTFQEHVAPNTTLGLRIPGRAARRRERRLARDDPRRGDAQRTNAYQENRNLSCRRRRTPTRSPGLEILANDVRCTHGATNSPVNRDELFYCMARGLSRGEAERLIVRGFFQDMLDRIQLEPVREAVAKALEARIPPPEDAGVGAGSHPQGRILPARRPASRARLGRIRAA